MKEQNIFCPFFPYTWPSLCSITPLPTSIVRSPLNYAFQVGGFCEGKTTSHFQRTLKTSATFDPSTQSVCPTLLYPILGKKVRKECCGRIWRWWHRGHVQFWIRGIPGHIWSWTRKRGENPDVTRIEFQLPTFHVPPKDTLQATLPSLFCFPHVIALLRWFETVWLGSM